MRRYWVDKNLIKENLVHFSEESFHHIFDVCRNSVGNHFEVITSDSKAYLVKVLEVGKKTAKALIEEERTIAPLRNPKIHLLISVPKFSILDNVIEKSVELGVSSVRPFTSDNSFIKNLTENDWQHKLTRWNKIIISATQQCGRGQLMDIHKPANLNSLIQLLSPIHDNNLNLNGSSMCLVFYEGDAPVDVKQYLKEQKQAFKDKNMAITDIFIFIGSEGGFSEKEITLFKLHGFSPVTLGEQVLRVETACITAISILKYEFDLMEGL